MADMEDATFFGCEVVQACVSDENDDHADDATWVLTSSFVILTMQSGFGLLEMGSSMPGFEVNIMVKNVMDVVFGALAYWIVGYGLSYGQPSNPFCGMGDFCPNDPYSSTEAGLMYSQYIFQFSFAATATTIVSGAIAMRMKFGVYVVYSAYAVIIYSFVAHWVWAEDGWLKALGAHDFAGGGPVHLLGGMNGLIAIIFIGPRTGYFKKRRNRQDYAPASPASTLFGLFMLWWGWIGFNCGSTFGITGSKWVVATRAAIVTINASAAGGATALFYTLRKTKGKQVRVHHIVNGILGGLVATSPTCAVVHTWEALIIGSIGSLVANLGNTLVKRLRIDDPVGAVGVHLVGAIWGLLAVGLFADGNMPGVDVMDGLFRGGGFKLLGLQILAIVSILAWSAVTVTPFYYFLGVYLSKGEWRKPRIGLRLSEEAFMEGEDKRLHGIDLPYDSSIRFSSGPEDSSENEDDDDYNSQVSGTVSDGTPNVPPTQHHVHHVWPPTDEWKENAHTHNPPRRRQRTSVVMGMPTREGHDAAEAARHVRGLNLDVASSRSLPSLPSTIEASFHRDFRDEEKAEAQDSATKEEVEEKEQAPVENGEERRGSVAFSGVPEVDKQPSKRHMMMMKRQASSRRGVGGMM